MKWFRPKVWGPLELACLKWSSILFGMIVGAYVPAFTRRYVWAIVVAMILLAIKPVIAWFRNGEGQGARPNLP